MFDVDMEAAADEPQEKVVVGKDDLWKVVNYLYYDEEKDYGGEEGHIYRPLLPLAEACGYIESAAKRLAEIHADLNDDDEEDDDDEEVDRLLDELNS
jgi:hypothetical protein